MSRITDQVSELARPVVEEEGCSLWDVEYVREAGSWYLRIYIDKEGGVDIADCERISRRLDPILDEADPTGGAPYHLNVSSPGLDRPIKTERDFNKKKGTKVEALFYAPKDGAKRVEGILVGWSEQQVELEVKGKTKRYDKKDIAVLRPVIEF